MLAFPLLQQYYYLFSSEIDGAIDPEKKFSAVVLYRGSRTAPTACLPCTRLHPPAEGTETVSRIVWLRPDGTRSWLVRARSNDLCSVLLLHGSTQRWHPFFFRLARPFFPDSRGKPCSGQTIWCTCTAVCVITTWASGYCKLLATR
jgi:hypothetical protein